MRAYTESEQSRFWSKVKIQEGCWIWLGGFFSATGRPAFSYRGQMVLAYRVAYELLVGPIPDGLTLDHIKCDNKRCVNGYHCIPATRADNTMRGHSPCAIYARNTHCKYGHKLQPYRSGYGATRNWRKCRVCNTLRNRLRKATLRLWAWYGHTYYKRLQNQQETSGPALQGSDLP